MKTDLYLIILTFNLSGKRTLLLQGWWVSYLLFGFVVHISDSLYSLQSNKWIRRKKCQTRREEEEEELYLILTSKEKWKPTFL